MLCNRVLLGHDVWSDCFSAINCSGSGYRVRGVAVVLFLTE
jgi:hypothetical protein